VQAEYPLLKIKSYVKVIAASPSPPALPNGGVIRGRRCRAAAMGTLLPLSGRLRTVVLLPMRARVWRSSATVLFWLLLAVEKGLLVTAAATTAATAISVGCPHPAVPSGATYFNISGGLGADSWRIKYDCDIGG
jgi:hypothetical protein